MKKTTALLLCLILAFSLMLPAYAAEPGELTASAQLEYIQKYGNVYLSITGEDFRSAGYAYGDIVTVSFLGQTLDLPFCSNFSDVDSGNPGLFLRNQDPNIILAINMGDFATTYGIAVKTTNEDKSFFWSWAEGVTEPVQFTIFLKEAAGYLEEYTLRSMQYTDVRADYPDLTDAGFANFRAVETTGMGKGVLYRSCSPINPLHNRSTYADAAIRAAGVTVVLNLADDEATARSYEGFAGSYYSSTSFIALNMGVDFTSPDFKTKLAEGIRFLASHPGVYAVHCTEGKERAGFVAAVLECLMGASYPEVAEDFMDSYYNYFGIIPGEARYDIILNNNLIKTLSAAFGVSDLSSADLSACAEAFLKDCGVSDADMTALKANLSAAPAKPEPQTAPAPAGETAYTVAAGDCLWNLAKRFYGDALMWRRIADANGLRDPYIIRIGQCLVIPA